MSELVLINPRRRRRRAKGRRRGRMPPGLARYWASRRGTRRRKLRAPRRHRARRRAVAINPRMHRRTIRRRRIRRSKGLAVMSRRRYHKRYSRRRIHRNPRFGIPSVRGIVRSTIMPAAIGATGALALDVAYGYASPYLPALLQGRAATLGVKILGAIGIGLLASRVLGRERGRIATLGAATVVVYGVAKSALASALPTVKGLSGYSDFVDYSMQSRAPGMGFYSPAAVIQGNGVGAYLPPANTMGAYMPNQGVAGLEGGDGYNWQNDGM